MRIQSLISAFMSIGPNAFQGLMNTSHEADRRNRYIRLPSCGQRLRKMFTPGGWTALWLGFCANVWAIAYLLISKKKLFVEKKVLYMKSCKVQVQKCLSNEAKFSSPKLED